MELFLITEILNEGKGIKKEREEFLFVPFGELRKKQNLKDVEEIEQIDYGTVNDEEVIDNNTVLEETVNEDEIIRPKKKTSTLDDGIIERKRKGKKNNV